MKQARGCSPRGLAIASALGLLLSCSAPTPEPLGETRSALAPSANEDILGFESPEAWSIVQGTLPQPTASAEHTEGVSSLALQPAGYVVVTSQPLPILSALTGSVSYDLFVPSAQANGYWFGATQLYLNCPSHNIFNAFVGQAELTGMETDQFHNIAFTLSDEMLPALGQGCADLSISIAINVPWNEPGTYLLDNLQIGTAGDFLSPVLSCVFTRDQSLYYAQFSYQNSSLSTVTVPVGSENFFIPTELQPAQSELFLPGSSPQTFTVPFDGTSIAWHLGRTTVSASSDSPACPGQWVSSWTGRGPLSTTITTNRTAPDPVPNLTGRTLRVMAHLTTGGSQVRVRLSQRFSSDPLGVEAAHVAIRSTGSSILPDTDQALTFAGEPAVAVPAGGDVWSDPVELATSAGQDLAISLYVPGPFVPTTEGGRGQIKTAYYKTGNMVSAVSLPSSGTTRQVFGAYEVQVLSPGPAAAIVALGDSITEGACSSIDANGDFPDLLAARLPSLADGTGVAVLNAGIGSGRFATSDGAGLRGLTRLDELLTFPAVRWVTLLMGVNDISYEHADAAFLTDAYMQAIAKAHLAGVKIIGIPILPFGNSTKDVGDNKQIAQDVNAWIRAQDKRQGAPEPSFDAIVDLEPVVSDPNDPAWAILANLTCDHVHPNQGGYRAIAAAIPLDVFQ